MHELHEQEFYSQNRLVVPMCTEGYQIKKIMSYKQIEAKLDSFHTKNRIRFENTTRCIPTIRIPDRSTDKALRRQWNGTSQ